MKNQMISKREFLKLGVTGFLTACSGCKPLAVFSKKKIKRIPVGVQLYSVRHECEKDLPVTIEKVAKMGYEGVEFAGYYGRDAKTLRKLLDDTGLLCCGTHTQINTLLGDGLPKTIGFNKTIGGTEWYIVEYESDAYPPLVSIEKSLEALRGWGKV